jgi:hypothetical protein
MSDKSKTGLVAHPVAALFPDLDAEDFARLKEDIARHGVKVPRLSRAQHPLPVCRVEWP